MKINKGSEVIKNTNGTLMLRLAPKHDIDDFYNGVMFFDDLCIHMHGDYAYIIDCNKQLVYNITFHVMCENVLLYLEKQLKNNNGCIEFTPLETDEANEILSAF